mmetsp:Transcript_8758/g.17503  ORF Transcript_8758/g.17503 Transcript_8758/m.17503 type:complete len:226 (-) Transcript_8758:402-1079(-)
MQSGVPNSTAHIAAQNASKQATASVDGWRALWPEAGAALDKHAACFIAAFLRTCSTSVYTFSLPTCPRSWALPPSLSACGVRCLERRGSLVDGLHVEPHAVDAVRHLQEVVLRNVHNGCELRGDLAQLRADDVVLHHPVVLSIVHLRDPLHKLPEPRHVGGGLVEDALVDLDDGRVGEVDTCLLCQLSQRRVHRVQPHLQLVLRVEHRRVHRPDRTPQHHNTRVS